MLPVSTLVCIHTSQHDPQLCSANGAVQPLFFSIKLREAPSSPSTVSLMLSDETQAQLQPAQVVFDSSNWTQAVNVTLTPSAAHLLSPSASPISLVASLEGANNFSRSLSLKVADCMGDGPAYPYFIPGLPISLRGSTLARKPLQVAVCSNVTRDKGLAPAAVYLFRPKDDVEVSLSTCRTAQLVVRGTSDQHWRHTTTQGGFDTKLVVYQDVDQAGFDPATATPLLCSNSPCMAGASLRVAMQAEVSYAIVLTGFAGKAGSYQLDLKAANGTTVQGLTPSTGKGNSSVASNATSTPVGTSLPFAVWGTGTWSPCSAACGAGTQKRAVVCVQGAQLYVCCLSVCLLRPHHIRIDNGYIVNAHHCHTASGSSVVDESLCLNAPSKASRPDSERRCDILCPAATLWQPANLQQLDMATCRAAGVLCRSQQQDTAPAWTCAAPQGRLH